MAVTLTAILSLRYGALGLAPMSASEQDVDRLERADLAVLEAAHDVVEGFERPRHLRADQVVADAVERARRQVTWAAHGRHSWARRRATAS